MIIRSIRQDDIQKFENIGVDTDDKPTLNLVKWLNAEKTKLEWCFVAEKSGEFLGRIMFGVFEDQPYDLKIWQIKIEENSGDFFDIGSKLIKESINSLKEEGFKTVELHLYTSLSDPKTNYIELFKNCNFRTIQEKKSYEIEMNDCKSCNQRLRYKTLKEVGQTSFINAIEAVTIGTLDRDDQESVVLNGKEKAAIEYFEILKDIDFNEEWWRLAYEPSGDVVGLVVPQCIGAGVGAVNYIGVVPSKRGSGYVTDLLQEASSTIQGSDISKVIADIDNMNFPLEKALINLGYDHKRSVVVLKMKI